MDIVLGAHHFADFDLGGQLAAADGDVLRTNACYDGGRLLILGLERLLLEVAEFKFDTADLCIILAVLKQELAALEEVHNGHADESRNKEVDRLVEQILRRTDLVNVAVLHDNDAVGERHSLGLVVGNVHKGGVDTFSELDDLRAHLVSELCVKVGERLVHQENLGVTDHGTSDGNTLSLTAGKRLRLAVEVLGNAEDVGDLVYLFGDLRLGRSLELERKRHVVTYRHVGIQRVVLENHRNISVLGDDIVHQLAVDIQLALGDALQTRDHAQGGGLSAAGRTYQHDEFLVGDLQVDVVDRSDLVVIDFLDPF